MADMTILVVDDDKDLSRGLGVRLKANGYRVHFAWDGVNAVQEARRVNPDLILLDIGLPGGDGYSVMERLSSLPGVAAVPVIIISARDAAQAEIQSIRQGAVAFFQKPVDNDELLACIGKVLEGASVGAGAGS